MIDKPLGLRILAIFKNNEFSASVETLLTLYGLPYNCLSVSYSAKLIWFYTHTQAIMHMGQ